MYTYSSRRIVENAANPIDTGSLNSGLLRPEQSRRFLQQVLKQLPCLIWFGVRFALQRPAKSTKSVLPPVFCGKD